MRILFTGVGRRIELLQAFRNAARHSPPPYGLWLLYLNLKLKFIKRSRAKLAYYSLKIFILQDYNITAKIYLHKSLCSTSCLKFKFNFKLRKYIAS